MKYMQLSFLLFCLISISSFAQTPVVTEAKNGTIQITKMDVLNSEYRETNISITPQGRFLYFMSGRGGENWSSSNYTLFNGIPEYDGDIWMSEKRKGKWSKPQVVPPPISSSKGEDEPVIAQDGQRVYFQSWAANWQNLGGPYWTAELDGSSWKTAQPLAGGIHQFFRDSMHKHHQYATDGMSVSPNQRLLIVAAGKEYDGNLDLYISRKENNEWSYLKKLPVSTQADERSAFISGDGTTIYFASSGYGGQGGLDIFKGKLDENGNIDQIVNLGKPFNTEKDDYGFIVTANGNEAYFIRDGDIYHANLKEADKTIKPQKTMLISGKIHDSNGLPVKAKITIETPDGNFITEAQSNKVTGEYAASIPYSTHLHNVKLEHGNYTKNIDFMPPKNTYEIEGNLTVDIPQMGDHIVLFPTDKFLITAQERTRLKAFLKEKSISIHNQIYLSGHTDSQGSSKYNQALSQKRVRFVRDMLIELGISSTQIKASHKGEDQPTESNSTAEGRKANRRVELLIK